MVSKPKVATYRVQLRPDFDFSAACALVDYWALLGVSHLYTSPCLQAARGSTHGYDVVDHSTVNEELGGETARRNLVSALERRGLGQLLDIVPNHMAIRGGHNAWWWDVLENGPSSRYSSYFDVEWEAAEHDRVLLPILGDQYGVELEAGRLKLRREGSQFLIEYYEHRNPVAPRSLGPILRRAAERAHSDELGFLADAYTDLPLPNAPDLTSRRRRHRDKQVLARSLSRLLDESRELELAVDEVVEQINADPDQLHQVLERQSYRLSYWRVGNHELDYRRFFDIDSLVGLRVEDAEVFDATHELPLGWLREGAIDGLRIDHVDGLYDPNGYLERLRKHAPEAWLLVEKILEGEETLPAFPIDGSTGYDFLNHTLRVLLDPSGEAVLDEVHRALDPSAADPVALARDCKRLVLEQALASDLKRLLERLCRICRRQRRYRDFSHVELGEALRELCVAFPVYRTYLTAEDHRPSSADAAVIERACHAARAESPTLDGRLFDFLRQLLSLECHDEEALEFVLRWQQLTGPAMAKGLEDTAFYRHCRLVALNEVGGDLGQFSETLEQYHTWLARRQSVEPWSLNATSTHDTKRSEDVRARLLVLSEMPERWREVAQRWRLRLAPALSACPSAGLAEAPEPLMQAFILQNLVGAWPIERDRLHEYVKKSMREAKRYSSWHRPNEAYEKAVLDYVDRLYHDQELCGELAHFVASIERAGYANSLSQLVLKLLAPGVPDIYQGTELWDFSLVDPDNRRPVDYQRRQQMLREIAECSPERLWDNCADGAVKLYCLIHTLRVRRRHLDSLSSPDSYQPLRAEGARQERVLAFLRGSSVIGIASRWYARWQNDFGDTWLVLPEGRWQNTLAPGGSFSGRVEVQTLLGPLPVACLEREGAA